jgi:PAS domain S-box-containing protein
MGMLLIFMIYYPAQQKKLLTEFKKNELFETAESVSTAVVLSLKNDDYDGVRLAISHASEKKDFEFIAVLLEEAGKKTVLASYPEIAEEKVVIQTNNDLIYEEAPFEYGEFKGSIIIAVSKIKINNTIKSLTQPIYITAFIFLIISIVLFYFLGNQLSRPITKLIRFTEKLKEENYETPIKRIDSKNEIGALHNSIAGLQDNLIASRKRNKELTEGLEEEVLIRTTELKSTAEKLLQAQHSAGIGNFEYDIEKDAWEASPNVYDILNIPYKKSYPIEVFLNLLDEKDQESAFNFYSSVDKSDVKFEQDFKIYRNKNSNEPLWIHFIYYVIFDSKANAIMTRGTIQDITYRKKIEDELKELSMVAKNTSNYVIIADKDRKIKWVNDSFMKVSGYTLPELLGKNPKIFQCEKTNPATVEYIRNKLANHEEVKTEILNKGKNGNEYWLELNIVPIKNDQGELSGYIAVETDITEIKNSEENIRKLNESLEIRVLENTKKNLELSSLIVEQEKLATIGELAAGVAHDMNTPLSSTKVGAESLQFATKEIMRILPTLNPQEQKDAIAIAEKNKMNLAVSGLQKKREEMQLLKLLKEKYNKPEEDLTVIANKLTECRISQENDAVIEQVFQSQNPVVFLELIYNIQLKNALLESILTSTENASSVVRNLRSFINKGVTPNRGLVPVEENIKVVLNIFQHELKKDVELDMQIEAGLKIFGFDIKLFQLWSNLLKNSIESMDRQELKRIIIKGYSTDKNIIVEFSNNGPQIPAENIEKIFRKFYSTKRSKTGTGLGLSIVKNVMEDHHAKINVSSTPELTTFSLIFPKPATA